YELAKAKELLRDAIEAAMKHDMYNVLVDNREIEGDPPTTMMYYEYATFVAKLLMEMRINRGLPVLRLAYVSRASFFDESRFAETVAVNRGVIGMNTDDFDEALAWLLKKDTSSETDAGASGD
ncbi:MAG: hypothetical protein ACYS3N_19120, partial [Planctomycetota bacterium]